MAETTAVNKSKAGNWQEKLQNPEAPLKPFLQVRCFSDWLRRRRPRCLQENHRGHAMDSFKLQQQRMDP